MTTRNYTPEQKAARNAALQIYRARPEVRERLREQNKRYRSAQGGVITRDCSGHACDGCGTCRRGRCCRRDVPDYALPVAGSWDGPLYGRLGLLDVREEGVECHACGDRFLYLGVHAWAAHDLTSAEYKATFGLRIKRALAHPSVSAKLRTLAYANGSVARAPEIGREAAGRMTSEQRTEYQKRTTERHAGGSAVYVRRGPGGQGGAGRASDDRLDALDHHAGWCSCAARGWLTEPAIEVDSATGEVTAYDDERRIMAIGPDEATAKQRFAKASAARSATPSDDIPSVDAQFVRESGGDDRIRTDE